MLKEYIQKIGAFWNRGVKSPYDAAGFYRRSLWNWNPPVTSASSEISTVERRTLEARAYDAFRNHQLARAIVSRVRTNVVGSGLKLNPMVDGEFLGLTDDQVEELEEAIEREFGYWSMTCDLEGSLDFGQMQLLGDTTQLITGDCFTNTVFKRNPGDIYSLKLQIIDSARITNPDYMPDSNLGGKRIQKGIETDSFGRPVKYHVLKYHPSDAMFLNVPGNEWDPLAVYGSKTGLRRVFHEFNKERPGQVRGVSFLAPILEPLIQAKKLFDGELMRSALQSNLTFFIESAGDEENFSFEKTEDDPRSNNEIDTVTLGNGAVVELEEGKKVNMANPMSPNSNFDPFFDAITGVMSAALEIPPSEVMLRYKSSFSAARGEMLKAWQYYKVRKHAKKSQFLCPSYCLWFAEAVALGRLPHVSGFGDPARRIAYTNTSWESEGRGAIDELKEASASNLRLQAGITSLIREAPHLTGLSFKTIVRQQKKALGMLERAKLPIPKPLNVEVDTNPESVRPPDVEKDED